MHSADLFTIILDCLGVVALLGGAFAVWRSSSTKTTIDNYKDSVEGYKSNVDALLGRVSILEDALERSQKEVSNLREEVRVVKDLPLAKLLEMQNTILDTQNKILAKLEASQIAVPAITVNNAPKAL